MREGERRDWAWYREHNISFRPELSPDETIVAGTWPAPAAIHNWCSLSEDMARWIGAEVGDTIIFEAQGVPIEVQVTSLRDIEWSFYPNFFVLVNPELIQDAPLTWAGAIPTDSDEQRIALQMALSSGWPNVTAYDVAAIADTVESLIARVLVVVRGMGLFTLAAGVIVLLGLAVGSLAQRQAEAALLRALGVRRAIIRRELLREYTVLGIASGVLGVVLALLSTVWILPAVFDLPWVPPVGELLLIAAGVALIVIGSAWWGLRSVYRVSTAAVLRKLVDS